MPLYEVAILEQPTRTERDEGLTERLISGPKALVARDAQHAGILAVLDRDEANDLDHLDRSRLMVLVRPFVVDTIRLPAPPLPLPTIGNAPSLQPFGQWQGAAQAIANQAPPVRTTP